MKNIMLVCIFVLVHSFVFGQHVKNVDLVKTKIYILGVVHTENKFRNSDSLLNILKDIKPDLILSENDTLSGYFKSDYTLVQPPKWYKVARKLNVGRKMPPEMDLLYKYQEINNSVLIYPFDITIVNRNKYVASQKEKENLWVSDLNFASSSNKIPYSILPAHRDYIRYSNWLFEIGQGDYRMINRTIVIDSIRNMMKLEMEYFPKLIKSVQGLSDYNSWYAENINYWVLRNEVMSKNIIKFIEMTNAKKVVVLTGILHKYYLTDLLNSYSTQTKFEIVEYFDK